MYLFWLVITVWICWVIVIIILQRCIAQRLCAPMLMAFCALSCTEHVRGAERQNFPLIAQLHLRESRSQLRSRSDDLPLPLRFCSKAGFKGGGRSGPQISPPVYTGYESLNESHSGLRYLRRPTGASMVQRQSTWHYCCSAFPTYILASDFALLRLLTWWCHGQFAPPSVNGLSSQQLHPRGMLCLVLSVLPHQCYSSEVDSGQNYSRVHTSSLTEFVSASLWLNIFVPWCWNLWIYVTLMTILILTN